MLKRYDPFAGQQLAKPIPAPEPKRKRAEEPQLPAPESPDGAKTFNAWLDDGRVPKAGEKGCKHTTFVTDDKGRQQIVSSLVFSEAQTEPLADDAMGKIKQVGRGLTCGDPNFTLPSDSWFKKSKAPAPVVPVVEPLPILKPEMPHAVVSEYIAKAFGMDKFPPELVTIVPGGYLEPPPPVVVEPPKPTPPPEPAAIEHPGHHITVGEDTFADTAFINIAARLGGEIKHLGFGDFEAVFKDGSIEFIRRDDYPIPGKQGRAHILRGPAQLIHRIISEAEARGLSINGAFIPEPELEPESEPVALKPVIHQTIIPAWRRLFRGA